MKIRQGFVSNSSTSSFLVSKEAYSTIFDIAVDMVKAREWEDDKKLSAIINKMKAKPLESFAGGKVGISFSTCNYDTFIMECDTFYAVATCHNHDFYDLFHGYDVDGDSEEVRKQLVDLGLHIYGYENGDPLSSIDGGDLYESIERIKYLCEYWFPEYDLIGELETETRYYNSGGKQIPYKEEKHCEVHPYDDRMIRLRSGKVVCPLCYRRIK